MAPRWSLSRQQRVAAAVHQSGTNLCLVEGGLCGARRLVAVAARREVGVGAQLPARVAPGLGHTLRRARRDKRWRARPPPPVSHQSAERRARARARRGGGEGGERWSPPPSCPSAAPNGPAQGTAAALQPAPNSARPPNSASRPSPPHAHRTVHAPRLESRPCARWSMAAGAWSTTSSTLYSATKPPMPPPLHLLRLLRLVASHAATRRTRAPASQTRQTAPGEGETPLGAREAGRRGGGARRRQAAGARRRGCGSPRGCSSLESKCPPGDGGGSGGGVFFFFLKEQHPLTGDCQV